MSKKITYQSARGTRDILPSEQPYWETIRKTSQEILSSLGYKRIDLPIFEDLDIFTRGIGEETDIVQKEIYLLQKKGDNQNKTSYALRPEGTAGTVRAYIQNGMNSLPQPVKLYYIGAMFRHDRPQKGRFRQFYQIGGEVFGDYSAKADFLSIMSAWQILKKIGLKNLIVYINSIGCTSCRPKYTKKLKKYYSNNLKELCPSCQNRYQNNPLRLLDCKEQKCRQIAKKAPIILDHLCSDCRTHFQNTLEYLDYFGIRYDLDPYLVRGLDYYNGTVFEITEKKDKERSASLGGGGRYDGLTKLLGGSITPAVGYSLGIDRIVSLMRQQKITPPKIREVEICILQLGEKAKETSKKIYDHLTSENINVYFIPSNDSLRSQLRAAAKTTAHFALIVGQKEAMKDEAILRDLKASAQETIPTRLIKKEIKKRLDILSDQ